MNTIMFYSLNWTFLLLLIHMLHKIRHIKDKLLIRDEMGYIIVTWTCFSSVQYFLFLCD